eukprot:gene18130-19940_t
MESPEGKFPYPYDRSAVSNTSSSTEEGGASSISFDCSDKNFLDNRGLEKKTTTKSNHSEVERKRRQKINSLINELSTLVPMGNSFGRKPDKVSVLKVAVQHMRILGLKSEQGSSSNSQYKPEHMDERDMERMLENATDGFLFVIGCDRLQVLYMSDKVSDILNFPPTDLIGKRLVDIVHTKDIAMLKEQLTPAQTMASTSSPMFISKKPEDPTKDANKIMCKRSFYCRFRNRCVDAMERESSLDMASSASPAKKAKAKAFNLMDDSMKDYTIVHCNGLLRSWLPAGKASGNGGAEISSCFYFHGIGQKVDIINLDSDISIHSDTNNVFTASEEDPLEFSCRFSADGTYLHVDPRMVRIFGYLPQDLIGRCCYKYIYVNDVEILQRTVEQVKQRESFEIISTEIYRMVSRSCRLVSVVASLFVFRNPLTEEVEFIDQQTTVVRKA